MVFAKAQKGGKFLGSLSIEDNLRLGRYSQPKHQVEGDMEKIFAMFPILKEKTCLARGYAVWWPAANAGDWSCADGAAKDAVTRRA